LYRSLFRKELKCILGGIIEKGKGKKIEKKHILQNPEVGAGGVRNWL
jgi:hypothetical protein